MILSFRLSRKRHEKADRQPETPVDLLNADSLAGVVEEEGICYNLPYSAIQDLDTEGEMILDRLINIFIFVYTVYSVVSCFRKDGRWDRKAGLQALRFFTILSNLFAAVASLLIFLTLPRSPYWIWLIKYIAACSVTVTFLTVMLFLGPSYGYKAMLSGKNFYLHLGGPLLALLSFVFLERFYTLPFVTSLLGVIPVILYGFVYLYEVVMIGCWDDFYGYNKNGKWPVSMAAMFVGGFLVCVMVRVLFNL